MLVKMYIWTNLFDRAILERNLSSLFVLYLILRHFQTDSSIKEKVTKIDLFQSYCISKTNLFLSFFLSLLLRYYYCLLR